MRSYKVLSVNYHDDDMALWKAYAEAHGMKVGPAVRELARRGLEAAYFGDTTRSIEAMLSDLLAIAAENLVIDRHYYDQVTAEQKAKIKQSAREMNSALTERRREQVRKAAESKP